MYGRSMPLRRAVGSGVATAVTPPRFSTRLTASVLLSAEAGLGNLLPRFSLHSTRYCLTLYALKRRRSRLTSSDVSVSADDRHAGVPKSAHSASHRFQAVASLTSVLTGSNSSNNLPMSARKASNEAGSRGLVA